MSTRAQQLLELRAARRAAAEGAVAPASCSSSDGEVGAGGRVGDLSPPLPPVAPGIGGQRVTAREQPWTPALVRARLDEAMKTLRRMGGTVGPKAFGNGLPEPVRGPLTLKDLIEQMHDPSLHRLEGNKVRLAATRAEVSRAEEAIAWAWDHLPNDGPRRVLKVWMRSRSSRSARFNAMCRERGWPLSTAKDALARAYRIIADALNHNRVSVR